MNLLAAVIAACSIVLSMAPALAVDGEILINQARVNAGGITPDDGPGFPATLSRPGRYKLTGNLTVPAGQIGVLVTQSDVTLDLNGYTISSNPPGQASSGVFASPTSAHRLRVMNGTITGFQNFGITNRQSQGAGAAVIENMRIVSNATGVFVGPEAQIRDSTIANSERGNIGCLQDCLIEGNVITGSGNGGGISMTGGTVLGNVIVSNRFFGIAADVEKVGYGDNMLFGNNNGGGQVAGPSIQLHPNVCEPACP